MRFRLTCVTMDGNDQPWPRYAVAGTSFVTWIGDHDPKHVHVYWDRKLVLKWDLENELPMRGVPTRIVLRLIAQLRAEGRL